MHFETQRQGFKSAVEYFLHYDHKSHKIENRYFLQYFCFTFKCRNLRKNICCMLNLYNFFSKFFNNFIPHCQFKKNP